MTSDEILFELENGLENFRGSALGEAIGLAMARIRAAEELAKYCEDRFTWEGRVLHGHDYNTDEIALNDFYNAGKGEKG